MRLPFSDPPSSGTLIAVEGVSRSGKSTLIAELAGRVEDPVVVSWNSHPEVHGLTTSLKKQAVLDRWSFSLSHLLDFTMTFEALTKPTLDRGGIVIADRYLYTAWVRDRIRSVPPNFLLEFFKEFPRPNVVLYLEAPEARLAERYLAQPSKFGRYGLGKDVTGLDDDLASFLSYSRMQVSEYRSLAVANDFVVADHLEHALQSLRSSRGV